MAGNAVVSLTTVRRHGLGLVAKNYASVFEKYIWTGSIFFFSHFVYLFTLIDSQYPKYDMDCKLGTAQH